ncbi:MAG: glycosyl hydrolase [Terriglobia bacterium]
MKRAGWRTFRVVLGATVVLMLTWIPAFPETPSPRSARAEGRGAGMISPSGTGMTSGADESKDQQSSESLFKGMKWRLVGPFRGGRVLAVAGVPGDPMTYYFGAAAGGVWKSTNGGVDWTPLFDKEPVQSIGAIAVADSDPNIIFVGTGEACIRGDISFGDGVYKSLDAGRTWTNVGLKDSRHIGKVIVDPRNPDIVFVAALGHAYGPNAQRGVFRSTDGGKTWEKVLYKDEKTGAIDLEFDPNNSHVLYAALWEAFRTPHSLSSGGPGSGLYKSSDGGTTWKRLEGNGLPKGILGRIGIAVSRADSNRVYAQIEVEEGGLFRSDDAGEKWTKVNDDHRFRQRAWYFTHIFADPKSVDTIYELNTGLLRSTDGGKNFTLLVAPHGDHHALWIDPANSQRMINGNDGGATLTVDGGKSWTRQDNQPTAQFYHVIADNRFPYFIYGSQQDLGTVAIASRTDHGVIGREDWYSVAGGEAGYIAPSPADANIVYAGEYEGVVTRFDKRTGQAQMISPWPEVTDGMGAASLKHRFQWTAPLVISPHDPNTLYHGAEVLFKTTDGGMSWTAISPDLTRNDKTRQQVSGGPITKDDTGTEYYDTIFAIAESPLRKDLIWVGSDDGLVHVTRDGGKTWANVTPKDLPEWSRVSLLDPSPHDPATAYLAIDRHQNDDPRPYLYKTNDYGKTWNAINEGLPAHIYTRAVCEDPKRKGLLFVGTETGVFVSFDDGAHWQPLQLNLPAAPVHDLIVKGDDLVVATHGRAFWILDDITPLRQFKPEIASEAVHLYEPEAAYRLRGELVARRGPVGENPPPGAIVDYYLKSAPAEKEEITLEILDSKGKTIRKYSNLKSKLADEAPPEWPDEEKPTDLIPAEAGLNRFNWDLRYEPPTRIPGAIFGDYKPAGPLALPGHYQVKLTVKGQSQTVPLEVKLDPRVKASEADLQKQFELEMKLRERVNDAHAAVNQMRDLRVQLQGLRQRLAHDPQAKAIVAAAEALDKKMTPVEEELTQPKIKSSEDSLNYPLKLDAKLIALAAVVESADTAPTKQSYELLDALSRQLDAQLARWKEIVSNDVAALDEMIRKKNIPVIILSTSPSASEAGK